MITTNDKLNSIYQTKLRIKNVIQTESDEFSEYPDLIAAAISPGGGGVSYSYLNEKLTYYVEKDELYNSSYATQSYVVDYVAEHGGGGSTVIDENIIPKENNTYTLGDSTYMYAATYTDAVYYNTNNKIYNTANSGLVVQRAGTDICGFLGGVNIGISPLHSNSKLGNSSMFWQSTYTSNIYSGNLYLNDNNVLYNKTQYQVNLKLNGSDKYIFRTNHLSPASDGGSDLGQSDLYWNNAYINNAYISNYSNFLWTGTSAEYAALPDYTTYQIYMIKEG